jgi:hypothetical protein
MNIWEMFVQFTPRMGQLEQGFQQAVQGSERAGRAAGKTWAGGFGGAATAGLASSVGVITGAFATAYKLAGEWREELASHRMLAAAFEQGVGVAEKAVQRLSRETGYADKQVRSMMASYRLTADALGLTGERADDVAKGLTELTYRQAEFRKIAPEEIFNRLQSGMYGAYRGLRSIQLAMTDVEVSQKALSMGLASSEKELTEVDKAYARYVLLMEKSNFVMQAQMSDLSDSRTAWRNFKKEIGEIAELLGKSYEPVLKGVVGLAAKGAEVGKEIVEKLVTPSPAGVAVVGAVTGQEVYNVRETAAERTEQWLRQHPEQELQAAARRMNRTPEQVAAARRLQEYYNKSPEYHKQYEAENERLMAEKQEGKAQADLRRGVETLLTKRAELVEKAREDKDVQRAILALVERINDATKRHVQYVGESARGAGETLRGFYESMATRPIEIQRQLVGRMLEERFEPTNKAEKKAFADRRERLERYQRDLQGRSQAIRERVSELERAQSDILRIERLEAYLGEPVFGEAKSQAEKYVARTAPSIYGKQWQRIVGEERMAARYALLTEAIEEFQNLQLMEKYGAGLPPWLRHRQQIAWRTISQYGGPEGQRAAIRGTNEERVVKNLDIITKVIQDLPNFVVELVREAMRRS